MSLTIITGTLYDFIDPFGKLRHMYDNGVFIKQVWDGSKWIQYNPGIISFVSDTKGNIVQETGAGKTIDAAILSYISKKKGRKIGGNLCFAWSHNNEIRNNKKNWIPEIRCMEDIENANNIHMTIDDISGTISAWNCKEAQLINVCARTARKEFNDIVITSQFLKNQIPPSLRNICGSYRVPFIRAFDSTRKAPDGKWFPIELIVLIFDSNFQYKKYKVYDLQSETAKLIMDGFNTLEISTSLKISGEELDSPRTDQSGYKTEFEAYEFLCSNSEIEWKHLNGKEVFDIQSNVITVDVVSMNPSGNLYTKTKDMNKHIIAAKKLGIVPYLMFKFRDSWGFIKISTKMNNKNRGKDIDIFHMKVKSIYDIIE